MGEAVSAGAISEAEGESVKSDPEALDAIISTYLGRAKEEESREKIRCELHSRYGEVTSEQIELFIDFAYAIDRDQWLNAHPQFVAEMQEKEAEHGSR